MLTEREASSGPTVYRYSGLSDPDVRPLTERHCHFIKRQRKQAQYLNKFKDRVLRIPRTTKVAHIFETTEIILLFHPFQKVVEGFWPAHIAKSTLGCTEQGFNCVSDFNVA